MKSEPPEAVLARIMVVHFHIEIVYSTELWYQALPDAETIIRRAAARVWEYQNSQKSAELCILLTNDDEVRALNHEYRGKDQPTNVLSFIMGEEINQGDTIHLGDIVLAMETVWAEAVQYEKLLSAHVSHLVVHGLLHLFGYDHVTRDSAKDMEAVEVSILADLGIADPYKILPKVAG